MDFAEASSTFFRKSFVFSERASRSEFWWAMLLAVLLGAAAGIVDRFLPLRLAGPLLSLALFLPSLSLQVRRLHDTDRSGWWAGAAYLVWVLAIAFAVAFIHHFGTVDRAPKAAQATFAIVLGGAVVTDVILGLTLLVWYCQSGTRLCNQYGTGGTAPHVVPKRYPGRREDQFGHRHA